VAYTTGVKFEVPAIMQNPWCHKI